MKISVIASKRSFNLEDYVVRALTNLGHDVQFLGYNEINGKKYSEFIRMTSTRSVLIRNISSPFWLKSINDKYKEALGKYGPELVLSLKGESVLPETLNYINKNMGIKTAIWFPDDPRFFNSLSKRVAPLYDFVFSYSQNGVENYRNIGVENAQRMSFGCDPLIHKRTKWIPPEVNRAVFVGTFTVKRYRIISKLIRNGIKIDIFGKYWRKFLPDNVVSEGVYGESLAEMFKKYKVSLNIHNDSFYGPNMRTFEVTGSGGTLITDKAEDTDSFFMDGKEAYFYQDIGELVKLINEKLSEDNDAIIELQKRAYEKSHKSYTYTEIMKNFLKVVHSEH